MNQAISETITEALNEIIRVNMNVMTAKLATDAEKELARVKVRDAKAALNWLDEVTVTPDFRATLLSDGNTMIEQKVGRTASQVADILGWMAEGFRNNPRQVR